MVGAWDTRDHSTTGARGQAATPPAAHARAALDNPPHPHRWNRYAYIAGTPLTATDPSGLDSLGCTTIVGCKQSITVLGAAGGQDLGGIQGGTGLIPWVPYPCSVKYDQSARRPHMIDADWNVNRRPHVEYVSWPNCGGSVVPGGGFVSLPPQPKSPTTATTTQTFSQCMAANSDSFSIAGTLQAGVNSIFDTSYNFSHNWLVSMVAGNQISGALFGSPSDAARSVAGAAPGVARVGIGDITTFGRRTSDVMSLNLAGAGGLPTALGDAAGGLREVLGAADGVLTLGLGEWKLGIDAAITVAEAGYCGLR